MDTAVSRLFSTLGVDRNHPLAVQTSIDGENSTVERTRMGTDTAASLLFSTFRSPNSFRTTNKMSMLPPELLPRTVETQRNASAPDTIQLSLSKRDKLKTVSFSPFVQSQKLSVNNRSFLGLLCVEESSKFHPQLPILSVCELCAFAFPEDDVVKTIFQRPAQEFEFFLCFLTRQNVSFSICVLRRPG